jgi:hypothetical protein
LVLDTRRQPDVQFRDAHVQPRARLAPPGTPLPLDLTAIGMPGCSLSVEPLMFFLGSRWAASTTISSTGQATPGVGR